MRVDCNSRHKCLTKPWAEPDTNRNYVFDKFWLIVALLSDSSFLLVYLLVDYMVHVVATVYLVDDSLLALPELQSGISYQNLFPLVPQIVEEFLVLKLFQFL